MPGAALSENELADTLHERLPTRQSKSDLRALVRTVVGAPRRSVLQHAAVVEQLAAGHRECAADVLREHTRMNAAVAEEIAAAHPEYFTPIEVASRHRCKLARHGRDRRCP